MRRGRCERGAATVELVWLTVLLIVPLVYLLLSVFEAQRAAFAVSSASQAAGHAFVRAPDVVTGQARAEQAALVALADHDVTDAQVDVECRPTPSDCLQPGSSVRVVVTVDQPLPLLPSVLGESIGVLTVDATHVEAYGTYREGRP
ncbi:hypothetical protein [Aeromicrobium sp. Leaf350]|uniref:hypothetical protein n=1 Tax=Aeromicrobium sp. Leaf350 TaxID=2876565 RepID=UPI001E30B9B8|nr:hypothetical protein [Aeromicrobium sp. Leaf350]